MFLSEELLQEIHERAPRYDKGNAWPAEDYASLKEAGYLKAFVPKEYGGFGLTLKEIAQEQTRLAMAAPGTALGVNMHQIIVGLGKHMVRFGNKKGEQILRDAAEGKLLAFGISEPSNDRVLFGSISEARPEADGAYRFYGKKVFLSMGKYCDKLVSFGQDNTGESPLSVFAYLTPDKETFLVKEDWDTMGMRATQSNSVELKGIFAAEEQILTKVAPGPSFDPVVFGIFAYFEILLAATYFGIGKRALEIGVETVKTRHSVSNDAPYANDKNIRWRIAEAAIMLDGIQPQINELSDTLEASTEYSFIWLPRLSSIKNRSVEVSKKAVEEIVRASGGSSYFNRTELSRLYRDVLAGLFQPSDQESLHDAWANILLGPIQ
ncbi:acyl-CoA dehydrogenase family protein [uncultured Granulicatella sp.]|uniref:acyl-CoA dehydrogenase family protein n=1 Tax=uncultured Granulicatella sp. TaxID=316089 RepID=UPI00262C85F8|nr:acyl-CoA dehydrogenase family protein [uncultured Granulicatella sp.]